MHHFCHQWRSSTLCVDPGKAVFWITRLLSICISDRGRGTLRVPSISDKRITCLMKSQTRIGLVFLRAYVIKYIRPRLRTTAYCFILQRYEGFGRGLKCGFGTASDVFRTSGERSSDQDQVHPISIAVI